MSGDRHQTPEEKHKLRKLEFDRNPTGQERFRLFATKDLNFRKMAIGAGKHKAEDCWEKLKDRDDFLAQLIDSDGMPNAAFLTSFEDTPVYPYMREFAIGLIKEKYYDELITELVAPAQEDLVEELKVAIDATPFDPKTIGTDYLTSRVNQVVGKAEKDADKMAAKFAEKWMTVSEKPPTQHAQYDTPNNDDDEKDESYSASNRRKRSDDEISDESTGSGSVFSPRKRGRTGGKGEKKSSDDGNDDIGDSGDSA